MKKSYSDKKISIEIKHLNVALWPGQMAELSNSAPINGSIGDDVTPDVKELPLLYRLSGSSLTSGTQM